MLQFQYGVSFLPVGAYLCAPERQLVPAETSLKLARILVIVVHLQTNPT